MRCQSNFDALVFGNDALYKKSVDAQPLLCWHATPRMVKDHP